MGNRTRNHCDGHNGKRDVIVYNHTGFLRYQNPFAQKQSIECFFIDNRAGGHFNVILEI